MVKLAGYLDQERPTTIEHIKNNKRTEIYELVVSFNVRMEALSGYFNDILHLI